jgi:hypothetical protein
VNTNARLPLSLGLALIFTCAALAQTAPGGDPGAPPPPQVRSMNGIEYINGGAGAEARAAIASQSADFALRIVFSVASGAYVVADHVDIANASGKLIGVDNVGPLLAVKVPPGEYSVEVSAGGKTERRPIRVGREPVTLNWRLPDEAKR